MHASAGSREQRLRDVRHCNLGSSISMLFMRQSSCRKSELVTDI